MKNIDLNLLPVLEHLIATESVTKTAHMLQWSIPKVSRSLAKLREQYDDQILVRSGKTMRRTPWAHGIREPLKESLEGIEGLFTESTPVPISDLQRQFRVRCDDVYAGSLVSKLSRLLQQEAPAVQVEFLSEGTTSNDDLRKGLVDVEIGGRRAFPPEAVVQPLGDQRIVALLRKDHPALRKKPVRSMLFEYAHVVTRSQLEHERPLVRQLERARMKRSVRIIVASYYACAAALCKSDLVATMPEIMASHLQDLFDLKIVELPVKLEPIQASIAWHSKDRSDAAHKWFRTTLRNLIEPDLA